MRRLQDTLIGRIRLGFNPEGEAAEGGGTQIPTSSPSNSNVGGGNLSGGMSAESVNNNTGEAFDADAFWGSQDPAGSGSSDSESASGDQPGSGTGETLRNELTQRLDSLDFGGPVFTQEMAAQINEGNFDGFNQSVNKALGQAVRQSLGLAVSVLRPFGDQIMSQVNSRIEEVLGGRDDSDQLIRDFPTAKDPKVRPVVENLYKQALKNTSGNREAAVQQVKSMLRLVSTSVADDLNLDVAPRGSGDSGRPSTPAVNWLDELSAR